MMNRLVPKVFYDNMEDAIDLFVDCMGFRVLHRDATLAAVERDSAKAAGQSATRGSVLASHVSSPRSSGAPLTRYRLGSVQTDRRGPSIRRCGDETPRPLRRKLPSS